MGPFGSFRILQIRTDFPIVEQECAAPILITAIWRPITNGNGFLSAATFLARSESCTIVTLPIELVIVAARYRGTVVARELVPFTRERSSQLDPNSRTVLAAQAPL